MLPAHASCHTASQADVDATLQEMMNQGDYFYKHDFGRNKRSRKWLILSTDGLSLRWRSVGATEVVGAGDGSNSSRGGSSGRGLLRSASFSRYTTSEPPCSGSLDPRARCPPLASGVCVQGGCQHSREATPLTIACLHRLAF